MYPPPPCPILTHNYTYFTKGAPYTLVTFPHNLTTHVFYCSCSGMWHYGYILNIPTLVILNFIGTVLNIIYFYMFIAVVQPKVYYSTCICILRFFLHVWSTSESLFNFEVYERVPVHFDWHCNVDISVF